MQRTFTWTVYSAARRIFPLVAMAGLFTLNALAGPDTEPTVGAQAAADALREAAGADAAFLAAGMVRDTFDPSDLSTILRYPSDEVAVVNLRGSQIRQALERSVSLAPSPSDSFLQLSGLEATYSRSARPEARIQSVSVGPTRLDDARTYTVAMPGTLARGGLGYFKIWDRSQIVKTLDGMTLSQILKGRRAGDSAPRWRTVP